MIRVCTCGHLEEQHGPWTNVDFGLYPTACLVLTDNIIDDIFDCKGCFEFQLDNLKSLEQTYNDKSKPIL